MPPNFDDHGDERHDLLLVFAAQADQSAHSPKGSLADLVRYDVLAITGWSIAG